MKKIGIIANYKKDRAPEVLSQIWEKAKELSLDLFTDDCTAELLPGACGVSYDTMFKEVDVVLALGGDGTMLMVVRELDGRDKPVIGFNIGALGFMTSVSEDNFDRALECLARDEYVISSRMLLHCSAFSNDKETDHYHALNDIVISTGPTSRIMTLEVSVNGDAITCYTCDGLIVATPTGSTGHSLSAGGPILPPNTEAFVISLICPHALSSRPLVLPNDSDVRIRVLEAAGDVRLSIDGQVGRGLSQGDYIEIHRSERNVRLINLPGHSYFDVLRQKLGWRGRSI